MLDNLTPALSKLALPSMIAIGDLRKSNMMALPHSTALKAFSSSLKMVRFTSEIGDASGHESSLRWNVGASHVLGAQGVVVPESSLT